MRSSMLTIVSFSFRPFPRPYIVVAVFRHINSSNIGFTLMHKGENSQLEFKNLGEVRAKPHFLQRERDGSNGYCN